MSTLTQTDDAIVGRIEAAGERIKRVQKAASAVIFGQEQVIERTLVTILSGGHALLIGVPGPFHVLATQNPLEQEGTYPLPEAQLDRFLLQIDVGYPDQGAERRMLFATTGTDERRVEQILTGQELMGIQRLVRQLPVPDK